jgi:hypothetical protein
MKGWVGWLGMLALMAYWPAIFLITITISRWVNPFAAFLVMVALASWPFIMGDE